MIDHPTRLSADKVRWQCDSDCINFETTDDVDPAIEVVGQPSAHDALMFGIECEAPGQNIYVRGARGTGRRRMVETLLEKLQPKTDKKRDYCYVHNFLRPQSPRLIELPPGQGPMFRKVVGELAEFIETGLPKAISAEPISSQLDEVRDGIEEKVKGISKPLEDELAASQLALVNMQNGPATQTVILPTLEGEPVPPAQLKALIAQGKAPEELLQNFEELLPKFQKQVADISKQVGETYREGKDRLVELRAKLTTQLVRDVAKPIFEKFESKAAHTFLEEVINDTIEFRLDTPDEEGESSDLKELYGVNVVLTHEDTDAKPVVFETSPSLINMLGTVEPKWGPGGMAISDYRGIRAGALLNADHGYLVLDANDVLTEPGTWRALTRIIRTGHLEIVPPEMGWMRQHVVIQPEPIPIAVRVILIGDVQTYYMLDQADPDFREHFKLLADFDSELDRTGETMLQYGRVVASIAQSEGLPAFHRTAVAELVEHGSRVAARQNKLTARFGRIADLVREAAFLAKSQTVTGDHVQEAIRRTKQRAAMPSRKFQQLVADEIILVQTKGEKVGQINGLAVMRSGPLTYGFPARITATMGPGRAGLINIEGRANMSGAIHTKGFHIIGGLLRHLLKNEHPLAFSASIAFEQSYGGIDGDSASGAEVVCLLSALTQIPVKQSMAMTGAIDQHGNVEAIGGVNEKIEGFFDACHHFGLTGDQGVVIPRSNQGDLMLRQDVADACESGQFHVYAVANIFEAMEVMTGVPAGSQGGDYAEGTLLATAVEQARVYWEKTLSSPDRMTSVEAGDHENVPLPTNIAGRVEGESEA